MIVYIYIHALLAGNSTILQELMREDTGGAVFETYAGHYQLHCGAILRAFDEKSISMLFGIVSLPPTLHLHQDSMVR